MAESPRYQSRFCEENVWHLARERDATHPGGTEDDIVLFISNEGHSVALWSQQAASKTGEPVIWDYHVVLLATSSSPPKIWDLDTILQTPTALPRWWRGTFPLESTCPDHLKPKFRLVPADTFLERFSSDRSHMKTNGQSANKDNWLAEPPDWDPIYDPKEGMNLPRFVDVREPFVGDVLTAAEFREKFDVEDRRTGTA